MYCVKFLDPLREKFGNFFKQKVKDCVQSEVEKTSSPSFPFVRSQSRSLSGSVLLRCASREWRRSHLLDAASVEIFGASLVHEIDDDAIDATLIAQSINAMASLRNNDMPTIRQIFRDFVAALRRRDRIHVAGKYQHRGHPTRRRRDNRPVSFLAAINYRRGFAETHGSYQKGCSRS